MNDAAAEVRTELYTMCLIRDGNRILLINRPDKRGFPGWIGPGGKVDFPESMAEGAIREVKEETGLLAGDLEYKGLVNFVDTAERLRYMVFNYVAHSFQGELLDDPPEGELRWIDIAEADSYPMQSWFSRRLPLFFEKGTFELYEFSDGKEDGKRETTIWNL